MRIFHTIVYVMNIHLTKFKNENNLTPFFSKVTSKCVYYRVDFTMMVLWLIILIPPMHLY